MEKPSIKTTEDRVKDMMKYNRNRIYGYLYLYLTRPVFDGFGFEGEQAIRHALRAYGHWRGERWRKWHEAEGLPLNLMSMVTFYDGQQYVYEKDELPDPAASAGIVSAYNLRIKVSECKDLYEVFKEEHFLPNGYVFCNEVHPPLFSGYHSEITTDIHECMTKGDDYCSFKLMMPPETPEEQIDFSPLEALQKRCKDDPVQFTHLLLKQFYNKVAGFYWFLAHEIIERFNKKGQTMVEQGLTELGRRRGSDLAQKLFYKGLKRTWANIWNNFDLPYNYTWQMASEKSSDDRFFAAEVAYCPMAEIWQELEDTELGHLYCDITYKRMFHELSEDAEIEIPECKCKGSANCRFEFKI